MQNDVIMTLKTVQGNRCWYQPKSYMRFPISD